MLVCVGVGVGLFVYLITGNKTRAESVVSVVNTYQERLGAPRRETHWGEVVIVFLEGKWHHVIILNPPTESFFSTQGGTRGKQQQESVSNCGLHLSWGGETAVVLEDH